MRLIDADALLARFKADRNATQIKMLQMIEDAPTVMDGWHDARRELPAKDGIYLTCLHAGWTAQEVNFTQHLYQTSETQYNKSEHDCPAWYLYKGEQVSTDKRVDYWMELPEPPGWHSSNELPRKSGWYYVYTKNFPLPQVLFYQTLENKQADTWPIQKHIPVLKNGRHQRGWYSEYDGVIVGDRRQMYGVLKWTPMSKEDMERHGLVEVTE